MYMLYFSTKAGSDVYVFAENLRVCFEEVSHSPAGAWGCLISQRDQCFSEKSPMEWRIESQLWSTCPATEHSWPSVRRDSARLTPRLTCLLWGKALSTGTMWRSVIGWSAVIFNGQKHKVLLKILLVLTLHCSKYNFCQHSDKLKDKTHTVQKPEQTFLFFI